MQTRNFADTEARLIRKIQENFPKGRIPSHILHYWDSATPDFWRQKLTQILVSPFPEEILPIGSLKILRNPIESVKRRVSECCEVDRRLFIVKKREKEPVSNARLLAIFICYRWRLGSSVHIGMTFNRHHTSVLYAMKTVPNTLKQLPVFNLQYKNCLILLAEDCRKATLYLQ